MRNSALLLALTFCLSDGGIALSQQPTRQLQGHTSPVYFVTFSSDGRFIASTSFDESARIWDARSGASLATCKGHRGIVLTAAFSPDITRLATGGLDRTIRLWEVPRTEPLESQQVHQGEVRLATISRNRERALLLATDGTALVRDLKTSQTVISQTLAVTNPTALAIHPDGKSFVIADDSGIVHRFVTDTLELAAKAQFHAGTLFGLTYSPNGSHLISAGADGRLCRWSSQFPGNDQQEKKTEPDWSVELPSPRGTALAVSHNGTEIAVAFADKPIATFGLNDGKAGDVFGEPDRQIALLEYSPNQTWLAATGEDKTIQFWRLSNDRVEKEIHLERPATSMTFSQDSKKLLVCRDDGVLQAFAPEEISDPRRQADSSSAVTPPNQEFQQAEQRLLASSLTENAQSALTVTSGGSLVEWKLAATESLFSLSGHGGQVYGLAFHPSENQLVSVSSDKTVRLWDLENKRAIRTLGTFENVLYAVAIPSGGDVCYVAGADRLVREIDLSSGRVLKTYDGGSETLYTVSLSPDGERIAAAGTGLGPDRNLLLWNRGTSEPAKRLTLKTDSIYRVQFDRTGEKLLAAGYNGHVGLFRIADGTTEREWNAPLVVYSGCLSPDGTSLVLGTGNNDVLLYAIDGK